MTIAKRMYLLIIVAAIGLAAMAGIGYYQMERVYQSGNFINAMIVPSAEALDDALADFEKMNGLIWQHMATTDNAKMQVIETDVAKAHQSLTDVFKKYEETLISDEEDKALLAKDRAILAKYDEMGGNVLTLSLANKKPEARDALLNGVDAITAMQKALSDHRAYNFDLAKKTAEQGAAIKNSATIMALGISLAVAAAVVLLGLFITRNLLKQLGAEPSELAKLASNFADGDLKQKFTVAEGDKTSVAYSIKVLQRTLD
ncbi:MAG TPA: MCP four helix bundle domain-containing protein, partial [Methylophilaceae bacterium]